HSQGDLPSVRRLKREVELIDRENEEKRAQKKLFDEGEKIAGTPGKALSGNDGSGAASKSEAASVPVKNGVAQPPSAVQTSAPAGIVTVTVDGKAVELKEGPLPESVMEELARRGHKCKRA